MTIDTLENTITTEQMREAVFEHTPCGYVVLEKDNTIKYVNPFFEKLTGIKNVSDAGQPCTLFEPDEADEVRGTHTRMQRKTPAGIRIFDTYTIPTDTQYKIYAVIDRTEEVKMLRKMDVELDHLLQLLQQLLLAEEDELGIDFCSPDELSYVKKRIEKIAAQSTLSSIVDSENDT